jgi:hypothetical protein
LPFEYRDPIVKVLPACLRYLHAAFRSASQATDVLTQPSLRLIEPVLLAERVAEQCNAQIGLMYLVANRKTDSQ